MEYLREYGVATHIYLPIIKRAVVDFAVGADWTPAAGDVKISKDGGAAANVTNLPSAITMGNTAMWDYSLTATELQAAQIKVTVSDSAAKVVEDQFFTIATYGNAAARHKVNLNDSVRAGLTALPNAAAEAAGGLFTRGAGAGQINQQTNGQVDANLERWRNAVPVALSANGYVSAMVLRWLTDNAGGTPDALSSGKLPADVKLWLASAPSALISGRVDANAQVVGDKTGYALSAAGNLAIWDVLSSTLTTVGSIGKRLVDFLTGDLYGTMTGAQAEPAAVPAANASPLGKLAYMAMFFRNRRTTTATQDKLYADNGVTVVATGTVSDDGTTFERTEFS